MSHIQITPALVSSIQRKLSPTHFHAQTDNNLNFDDILGLQVYRNIVSLTQNGKPALRALLFSTTENASGAHERSPQVMVTDGASDLPVNVIFSLQTFGNGPQQIPKNICFTDVQDGRVQRRFFVPQDALLERGGLQMTLHYSEDSARKLLSEVPLDSVKSKKTIQAILSDFFSLDTLLGKSNQEISQGEEVILIHVALRGESLAINMLDKTDLSASDIARALDSLVDRYLYGRKVEYPVEGTIMPITKHYYGLTPEGIEFVQKRYGVHFFSIN